MGLNQIIVLLSRKKKHFRAGLQRYHKVVFENFSIKLLLGTSKMTRNKKNLFYL